MKNETSPSQRIYNLYIEYGRRGLDTTPIAEAIKKATCTKGMDDITVVRKWLSKPCKKAIMPF